jgi:putative acetyltransferase
MLIRRAGPSDADAVRAVTAAAFARPGRPDQGCPEARLVDELRADDAWLPALSLVALDDAGQVIGHVLCTRAHVAAGPGPAPVLGLGPLSVRPDRQRRGVGQALMHAVLSAADALDESLVVLLGDPSYYCRFGFQLADELGVSPPAPQWRPHFQARPLTAYRPSLRGRFTYAAPFERV